LTDMVLLQDLEKIHKTKEVAMKLRGYLGVSIMIGFISWLPFLLILTLLVAYVEEITIRLAFINCVIPSVVFGFLYGFSMGYFYRVDTIVIKKENAANRLDLLVIEMAKLGYHPDNQVENVITFTPNIYAGKAAGNISVILKTDELILTGARYHIRTLKKKLR